MTQTARHALPLLDAGQAQKEITHNEALGRIDALLQLAVESRTAVVPPVANTGQAWIVEPGASEAWRDRGGDVAIWDDGWTFVSPREGCIAYLRDGAAFIVHTGGTWRDFWPVQTLMVGGRKMLGGRLDAVTPPSGGTTIDAEARAAIAALCAALVGHGLLAV